MKSKPSECGPCNFPQTHKFCLSAIFFSLLLHCLPQRTAGQGTVVFNNHVPGTVMTHVYNAYLCFTGNGTNDFPVGVTDWSAFTGLTGSGWFAQLLVAPGADQPDSALVPASNLTTFRTGAAAGSVVAVIATLANVPPDAPVATVQMAVWDNMDGAISDWRQAWWGSSATGLSPKFNVYNLGGVSNSPPYLTGLTSFSISYLEGSGQPWIFLHPQSQTVRAGSNVTFTVGTSLCSPGQGIDYSYQWMFRGSDLPGATNRSLTVNNVQFYHAGEYNVEVHAPPLPPWSA
jgi:hypothetical protein